MSPPRSWYGAATPDILCQERHTFPSPLLPVWAGSRCAPAAVGFLLLCFLFCSLHAHAHAPSLTHARRMLPPFGSGPEMRRLGRGDLPDLGGPKYRADGVLQARRRYERGREAVEKGVAQAMEVADERETEYRSCG